MVKVNQIIIKANSQENSTGLKIHRTWRTDSFNQVWSSLQFLGRKLKFTRVSSHNQVPTFKIVWIKRSSRLMVTESLKSLPVATTEDKVRCRREKPLKICAGWGQAEFICESIKDLSHSDSETQSIHTHPRKLSDLTAILICLLFVQIWHFAVHWIPQNKRSERATKARDFNCRSRIF